MKFPELWATGCRRSWLVWQRKAGAWMSQRSWGGAETPFPGLLLCMAPSPAACARLPVLQCPGGAGRGGQGS